MSKNSIVRCDEVVGCHLLKFLHGLDTINFTEAVDGSELFGSVAKPLDHHFIGLIKTFSNRQRIMLSRTLWDYYRNNCEIDEERLCVVPTRYSLFTQPSERLYIHACFGLEGFSKLSEAYRSSLFQCYCRLLPLNTAYYNADFGLLEYEWFIQTIGLKRPLNDHEKKLFRVQTTFSTVEDRSEQKNMTFVRTIDEFKMNMAVHFSSVLWLEAIDFSKFIIAGGCVLNSLYKLPFLDTKDQDINLIYYINNLCDFHATMQSTIDRIKHKISQRDKIVSTFPCLQALATQSFMAYTLHPESPKHLCTRIGKYYDRGFDLLLPIGFDGDLESMMEEEEIPLYRFEYTKYTNDEGEIYAVTRECYQSFARNVEGVGE
ncbi:unnamed protein product [Adineta ricciae]|uniref:Uncharacterized protein n=1 Tax=Adineta ricciae TaxID=249248 RepID=A0A815QCP7_ADIRI|nr:unnamed protein product [Adineta ricciae]CAF1596836.1 unnamed protein product [Adineta ricciae]